MKINAETETRTLTEVLRQAGFGHRAGQWQRQEVFRLDNLEVVGNMTATEGWEFVAMLPETEVVAV